MMEDRLQVVREFVKKLVEQKKMKIPEIASEVGYDRAMIYKLINNDNVSERFIEAVETFKTKYETTMQPVEEEATVTNTTKKEKNRKCELGRVDSECIGGYFRWTRDVRNVFGFCKITKERGRMSAILGKAGSGKTKSLQEFAYMNSDVIYIRCMGVWKKKHILRKVASKLGIVLTGNDEDDNLVELIEYLIENPKMIIFDEFDHLITQKSTAKVEVIRDLYDGIREGGSSIIIAGSHILKYVLSKRTTTDNYGQIDSRIYLTYEMQEFRRDEIEELIEDYEMTQDARELLIENTLESDNGKGRYLEYAIEKCLELSHGQLITKKDVIMSDKLAIGAQY